jgi:hypothetical protein
MDDPSIRRLSRRITALGDPALTDPLRRRRGTVEVVLKDGRLRNPYGRRI